MHMHEMIAVMDTHTQGKQHWK